MLLGIDFGKAKIGLAISLGELAEPYDTISNHAANARIKGICLKLNVKTIVVGISEGKSADTARKFGNDLHNMLRLPVMFVDETLSTIEAGNGKDDHQKAAAIILQRYIDELKQNA